MYVVVFRGVQYDSFFLNFHTFFFQSFVLFLSIISISNNEHWNTNLLQSNITKKHSLKIFCLIFHQNYLWNSFLQIFEFSKFRKRKTFGFDFFFSSIKGFFFVFVFLKKFINSHSFFFVLEKKKLKDQSMVCVHYIVYSHSGFKISKCSLTGKKESFFAQKCHKYVVVRSLLQMSFGGGTEGGKKINTAISFTNYIKHFSIFFMSSLQFWFYIHFPSNNIIANRGEYSFL